MNKLYTVSSSPFKTNNIYPKQFLFAAEKEFILVMKVNGILCIGYCEQQQ
jgi:hypothetical protein